MVRFSKRQKKIYLEMRYEAEKHYKTMGNWNWTMTSYWDEKERSFDSPKIKIIVKSKLSLLETYLKLNILTKEEYELEKGILNQVIKFCDERIKIYNN